MVDSNEPNDYEFEFFKTIFRIKRGFYNNLPEQLSQKFEAVELLAIHYLRNQDQIKTSVLADYLGIPASTLTGILDRMEKKDLIVRTRDNVDRRVVLVKLNANLLPDDPKLEENIGEYLRLKNIRLPSSWWMDVIRELKKLENLLIEAETHDKSKNWRLPSFVVLLGSITAFLESSLVDFAVLL